LVFGESVINDAVAIALFNALNEAGRANCHTARTHYEERQSMYQMAPGVSLNVIWIMTGSLTLGVVLALAYCLVIRYGGLRHNAVLETLYIVITCFFTYSLAHAVNLSGIIAVLFCSILMNVYAKKSLSVEGAELSGFLLKQMATLADMTVFLFCGAAVVLVHDATSFGFIVIGACLVGRAVAVLPLGLVINCLKKATGHARGLKKDKMNLLNWRQMFMMWHAGLRGGIALVLCLELGDWIDELEGPGTRQMLRNGTFITIFFFLMVFGGSTQFFLKTLGITMGKDHSSDVLFSAEAPLMFQWFVTKVHKDILLPVLVGEEEECETLDSTVLGEIVTNVAEGRSVQAEPTNERSYKDISESEESDDDEAEE
jgi:NhaP-type Na+/H+ or K+/H+ antiporter